MAMGIGCCLDSAPSQWQWNLQCWTLCKRLQEQVPDSVIFWSLCSSSKCPCWRGNPNHCVYGLVLYGSCFFALVCVVLIILHFGLLLWNMLFGFTTTFPTTSLVWHYLNYSLRPRPIIVTYSTLMYGVVQCMSVIQSYRMGKKFSRGLGQYLNFCDKYSSLMANVCHLSTVYVSPQYHLVFDDLFETVFSTGNDTLIDDICKHLFDSDQYMYFNYDEFIIDKPLVPYTSSWWSLTEWTWTL